MWERLIAPGLELGPIFFLVPVFLVIELLNLRRGHLARPLVFGLATGTSLGLIAAAITMALTMAGVFGNNESAMGGIFIAIFLSVGGIVPGVLAGIFYRLLGTTLYARVRRRPTTP